MKKYFIYAVSALALAGCSSDDFLGGQPSPTKLTDNNVINFNGGRSATTRAPKTESDAATALNNNFVVYGYKTNSDGSQSKVYDHYNVNWEGPAKDTESNTNGWEYVGYAPNALSSLFQLGSVQTIKYWDYSATQYDFIAFSFGKAKQVTAAPANANEVQASTVDQTPTYTLTGKVEDLAKVYIADRVTAKKGVTNSIANRLVPYGTSIPFNFRSLGTKVRIGLYETIPGYSVKDVKFYTSNIDRSATENPCLYSTATEARIPNGSGTMTVTFPTVDDSKTDYNKAHVSWLAASGSANSSILRLTKYPVRGNSGNEIYGDNYLYDNSTDARGTSGDNPTNPYITVLPARVGNLKLKVDYTLVSIDGSGEKINVTGATAVVPEVYTNWEPNYAYTYIFKISDKTNGTTGGDVTGLYPITFDAIVTETEDGLSETITTVSDPSITTYAKGAVDKDEYKAGFNIYVSVDKEGTAVTLSLTDTNTNCALYTAVSDGYNGGITESTVANCLVNGTKDSDAGTWTVTDAKDKTLTVKKASGLSTATEIEEDDAPDGNAITGKFAKFKPTAAGYYVFQYWNNSGKYYKVIKVVNSK